MKLGIDVGGTCTDFVLEHDRQLIDCKVATTPRNYLDGLFNGIDNLAARLELSRRELLTRIETIVHGTTLATNAVLTADLARTVLLTTRGHADVLMLREAGRMGLPLFDHGLCNPRPFIPRTLTLEVDERIDAEGQIVTPLDLKQVDDLLVELDRIDPQAIAICLLWSIRNPTHELELAAHLQAALPAAQLSLSHITNPCLREYRRASSTAIDAALKPLVSNFIEGLQTSLHDEGFDGALWLSSSEGTAVPTADVKPVELVRSGPALGPKAALHMLGARAHDAVLIDIGGTTLDVCLLTAGHSASTRETWLGTPYLGHMTGLPAVDVRSIGAGGGSIARVVGNSLIEVGPDSAGADPGPACSLNGGEQPTLIDAAVVLGLIDPCTFATGEEPAMRDAARRVIDEHIAKPLHIDVRSAAHAIYEVFVETCASGIEEMTVSQGIDLRGLNLIATGGAGGLVAVALARRLGCRRTLVPACAAVNCAAGGVLTEISRRFTRTFPIASHQYQPHQVSQILDDLHGHAELFAQRFAVGTHELTRRLQVEARYLRQTWEIEVEFELEHVGNPKALVELFHRRHAALYHHDDRTSAVEFLSWSLTATLPGDPGVRELKHTYEPAKQSSREVLMHAADPKLTPVYNHAWLADRGSVRGPAIIELPMMTLIVGSEEGVQTDAAGNIEVGI